MIPVSASDKVMLGSGWYKYNMYSFKLPYCLYSCQTTKLCFQRQLFFLLD